MDTKNFSEYITPRVKNMPGPEFPCMCALRYRAENRWWYGKKSVFLKYLLLNGKLGILDNFHNDGTVFSPASKKTNQKAQGKKKLARGERAYVPTPVI